MSKKKQRLNGEERLIARRARMTGAVAEEEAKPKVKPKAKKNSVVEADEATKD